MEKLVTQKKDCYGCTACVSICPKDAIKMVQDMEGFYYPSIDKDKCVDCGLCHKVCPHYQQPFFHQEQSFGAAKHKEQTIVANSSSGGIFTALSDAILKMQGIVYGCCFDDCFRVVHRRAVNAQERDSFLGSKYVQSNVTGIFEAVAKDLLAGLLVMFVGSPCQVAGLKNYINIKHIRTEQLLLCDFICHGASSPAAWEAYVKYLEDSHKCKLEKYHFRNKKDGWHNPYPLIVLDGKDYSLRYRYQESYFLLYRSCMINRPSCYACQFTSYNRCSDITLGDFWNIRKFAPQMDDNTGVSELLINTETGRKWVEECKDAISLMECTKQDVWQPHLKYPNEIPKNRSKFWEYYQNHSFAEVISKYGQGSFISKCKQHLTPILTNLGLYTFAGKVYQYLFVRKGHN